MLKRSFFWGLRKDKRIEKLVKLFLKINDSKFALKMVGKSFDIDVKKIKKDIEKSKSHTNVSIIDRYVKDQEIQKLLKTLTFLSFRTTLLLILPQGH